MNTIRVKICGITNLADARVAVEAGADLLGFILYPKSPRYIPPEKIAEIVREIRDWRLETGDCVAAPVSNLQSPVSSPQSPVSSLQSPVSNLQSLKFVGVFVNEPITRIQQILAQAGLDYAQLHSDEEPELLAALAGRAFKALRPITLDDALADAARFAQAEPSDGPRLFIDAYDPAAYGGTGKTANWHAAAAVARRHPGLLLAGGLTPANVAAAIRTVRPWGVDVSSGVEAEPGRKDHAKVRAFVANARNSATIRASIDSHCN